MDEGLFIAGDWGTSSLRLHLCCGDAVLDRKSGPGISKVSSSPAEVLFDTITPWVSEHGTLPIYLTGMVGSNIGWITTPYVECPVDQKAFANQLTRLEYKGQQVYIAGGISCTNPLGSPDVMRGEETQIFGALALDQTLSKCKQLVCLPGTHTKWALLNNGVIEKFHTALTGELYALLANHSVLIQAKGEGGTAWQQAFEEGAKRSFELADTALLHSLFEVRSRQISGDLKPSQASAYLSGMIIGRDISGALKLFYTKFQEQSITIIGTPQLTASYRAAIELYGFRARELDGSATAIAGLKNLFQETK